MYSQSLPAIVHTLDEAIRLDLQNLRDSYFSWLLISAAIVVIGIVMEGPEILYEIREVVRRRFSGQKSPDAPDWVSVVALIGWALVVLGVAGEVVAEGLVSRADSTLQTFNNILLSDAVKEAASAKASAVLAEHTIADERLETARIYSRLGPRHITETQQKEIAGRLSKYSGLAVDLFVLDQEDGPTMDEATNFGRDIVDALGKPMDASGFIGHGCRPWPVVGVLVEAAQDLSRDRYAAGEILNALKSFEVRVVPIVAPIQIPPCGMFSSISVTTAKPRSRTGWANIIIIVGKKPTPILSQMPASNSKPLPNF